MLSDVTLECSVLQREHGLVVTYVLRNGRDEDLGVFNRIQGTRIDGGADFSPDRVYVELQGEKLVLMKRILPLPEGLQVTALVPPCASLLPARGELTETFTVPLPAAVANPFKMATMMGEVVASDPRRARAMELQVGVFPLDDTDLVEEHPAFPGVFAAEPPGPAVEEQLVLSCTHPLSPPIVVLDYQAHPWP